MAKTRCIGAFVPPTLKQVKDYFGEKGALPWAEAFYARYDANGWTVTAMPTAESNWRPGRKPVRNWKQVALKFIERQKATQKNQRYIRR